jgi:hypothetical protein
MQPKSIPIRSGNTTEPALRWQPRASDLCGTGSSASRDPAGPATRPHGADCEDATIPAWEVEGAPTKARTAAVLPVSKGTP